MAEATVTRRTTNLPEAMPSTSPEVTPSMAPELVLLPQSPPPTERDNASNDTQAQPNQRTPRNHTFTFLFGIGKASKFEIKMSIKYSNAADIATANTT
jgi:hypothetical protein